MSEQAMRMEPLDLRKIKAQQFASQIMQIVGKYITDEAQALHQKAYLDLFTAAYDAEIEMTTREMRGLAEKIESLDQWVSRKLLSRDFVD